MTELNNSIQRAALDWHRNGGNVLPAAPDGTKKPGIGSWDRYKTERVTEEQLTQWLDSERYDGIGVICGAISGNLELLELEGRAADLLVPFLQALQAESPELLNAVSTYLEKTPTGGFHFVYRVEGPVAGNTKLARRPKIPTKDLPTRFDVLIETRGEGGWTILAPSAGKTHPTGGAWSTSNGKPGIVGTISEEQRDLVHAIAREFDEMPIPEPAPVPIGGGSGVVSSDAPGQDFIERQTWPDILQPAGWKYIYSRGDVSYWQRPGKNDRSISASTGHMGDWLYVFSSSTDFEPDRTYTKFGAYAVLNHSGDYSAAAKELAKKGFGKPMVSAPRKLHAVPSVSNSVHPSQAAANALKPAVAEMVLDSLTDDGNALMLVARIKDEQIYSPERKTWLEWDGSRYVPQPDNAAAFQAYREMIRSIAPSDDATAKFRIKSLGFPQAERAVKFAATDPDIRHRINELDADPYALNTPAGVVNLQTQEMTPPDPSMLLTKMTAVAPDFDAKPELFMRFLARTFAGHTELIPYIQQLIGYSIIGKVTKHILPFLHGNGANGKTVLLEIFLGVLGDYATTTPADFLLQTGAHEHSTSIARLAGQRLVVCSEVSPTAKFNEQRVKSLTGGDRQTAHFMRENEFTFVPTHQLWLVGNHEPNVESGGNSIWRRLRKVPFENTVPEVEQIEDLANKIIQQEGPAVLAWIVRGSALTMTEPAIVTETTKEYEQEEDQFGRFLTDRVHVGGGRTPTAEFSQAYRNWCREQGEDEKFRGPRFGREVKAHGIEKIKTMGREFYANVDLYRNEGDDDRPQQMPYKDD